jgi:hypothetical protein
MSTKAVLFPAGTTFRATVTAVDVDHEQLGALCAALEPSTALGRKDLLVHLGGGRPLGYGSCTVTIDDTSAVWESAARYGVTTDATDLLGESRRAFAARPAEHAQTWKALAKALSRDVVSRQTVTYPPVGAANDDDGFEFWKQSAGKELERGADGRRWGHPLTALPAVTDRHQTLDVIRKARTVPLPTQELLPAQQPAPEKKPAATQRGRRR